VGCLENAGDEGGGTLILENSLKALFLPFAPATLALPSVLIHDCSFFFFISSANLFLLAT
jgi:hypothetical protein